jgi:hypothetical protein
MLVGQMMTAGVEEQPGALHQTSPNYIESDEISIKGL